MISHKISSITKGVALGVLALGMAGEAKAQLLAGKTNMLLWGNLTPNFGLELVTSPKTSFNGNIFYSLDKSPINCSIKGVDAQLRYWISGRPMARSFIALGAQGMRYKVKMNGEFHYGDAVGPGLVYGYALPLGKRWNLEFTAGMAFMWFREKKYAVEEQEPKDYQFHGMKVTPMGLGISCSYIFK